MRSDASAPARRALAADLVLSAALAAATVAYLWHWPRDFYGFDEGLYLYESRRVLDGAVFYRDIFEIITPGAFYFMALLFKVFGVTLLTAKMGMAALHAAITVLVFLCCRRLGVRQSLALVAAAAHIAIAYPGLVIASPHWVGTFLTMLIAYLCLALPWRRPSNGLVLIGLVNGALVMVQQQKGVVIAAGVCAVAIADHLFARRAESLRLSSLVGRLARFLGAVVLVAGPLTLALVWAAGFDPSWECLVYFPLRNYPGFAQCRNWGYAGILSRALTPKFVAALPALAALLPLRLAAARLTGRPLAPLRPLTVVSLLLVAASGSVYYCPNYTHLVLIVPLAFILLAELVEASLGALASRVPGGGVAVAIAAGVALLALGNVAWNALQQRRAGYHLVHDSEVGPVNFRNADEAVLLQGVLDRTEADDEIFSYPTYPGIYFLTATANPTRFQIFLRNYHEPKHARELIDVLQARKVAYVVVQTFAVPPDDPVLEYLRVNYQLVQLPFDLGPNGSRAPTFSLLERRISPRPVVAPPPAGH